MTKPIPSIFARWLWTTVGMGGLGLACAASVLLLYGGNSWRPTAQWEASSLGGVEVSELVGTDQYRVDQQPSRIPNFVQTIGRVLRIPFSNPASMIESLMPATQISTPSSANGQTSMLGTLSNWENQSKKIALGWIQYDTAARTIQRIKDNPGINVACPQWLTLTSAKGTLQDRSQTSVIEYAHTHHIAVWGMVSNQFDAAMTHSFLADQNARSQFTKALVSAAKSHHLDGVNVDFENLRSKDQDNFTNFMDQLHRALAAANIRLSVDVTPDIVFLHDNEAFFHAGLAAVCDDVVVMAYDEHWGGDQDPGPVADVPWVTQAVNDLMDTGVPADKLILGLPFYTEFWYVHKDGSVSSEAVASANVEKILQDHNATSTWEDDLGVAYAQYPKSDGTMKVWYETDKTLARKLALVTDNDLAGVAIWSLNLSDSHTWSTVIGSLRQSLS